MTDMMIQDPATDELDDLRSLGGEPVTEPTVSVIDDVDALRDLADESDNTPIAEVEADTTDDPIVEAEPVADIAEDTTNDPIVEAEPVADIAEDTTNDPIVEAEPVAEVEADTTHNPVIEAEPVTVATVDSSADDDSYNPTLALRTFNTIRDCFIWLFDRILTGVAIAIEFVTGLDWAGYRDRLMAIIGMVHDCIPAQYRKAVYGVLIAIAILIPTSMGAVAFLSSDNTIASSDNPIVTVSQNNPTTAVIDNGILSPIFTPTVQQWADEIAIWTNGTNITPDMFALVMQLESCGNSSVVNGLFGIDGSSNTLADTDQQAQIALAQLQTAMTTTNGDFAMALAIYADGERILTDDFALWTPHARDMYILGRNIYTQAERGDSSSADLNSWLQNTGTILCTEAQSTRNN